MLRSALSAVPDTKKRKAPDAAAAATTEKMTVTVLGAGNEVGRSCVVMRYKGKTIMVSGERSLAAALH